MKHVLKHRVTKGFTYGEPSFFKSFETNHKFSRSEGTRNAVSKFRSYKLKSLVLKLERQTDKRPNTGIRGSTVLLYAGAISCRVLCEE